LQKFHSQKPPSPHRIEFRSFILCAVCSDSATDIWSS